MARWFLNTRWPFLTGLDKDPAPWPDDGGAKRVELYDRLATPPRLVRVVGWVNCLSHRKHRWLSPDVRRVRTCDDCKRVFDQRASARHSTEYPQGPSRRQPFRVNGASGLPDSQ